MDSLHAAAAENDVAMIRALVAAGADVNESNDRGLTPLFVAAHQGHAEAVAALLALGADVHRWDARGEPLMHWAAEDGSPEGMRLLLEAGADPNQRSPHGWTGLHEAGLLGRPDIAMELLRAGADPNRVDDEGMTPLLLAARSSHLGPQYVDTARVLLEHGAETNVADASGTSALEHAAANGDDPLVDLLLAHGARHTLFSAAMVSDLAAVETLLAQGASPGIANDYGSTPLHRADDLGVVLALLRHGADPNGRDSYQETPLQIWVQRDGDEAVGRALVEAGAEIDAQNRDGDTPLSCAAQWGQASSVKVLLRLGANPTLRNAAGVTPAEAARRAGYDEAAQLIEDSAPQG